jgi:methylphosphotriester-DNA--protein-cysteine methyltransferase
LSAATPLELWPLAEVDRLFISDSRSLIAHRVSALRDRLLSRLIRPDAIDPLTELTLRLISRRGGRVAIQQLAESHGVRRQLVSQRFLEGTGLPPKLFARMTRFQSLVQGLLTTDVARWSSLSSTMGCYDQAHMINEFRAFAGSAPTLFFRPHEPIVSCKKRVRGRPSEWFTREELA